jgi:hypothetical protein
MATALITRKEEIPTTAELALLLVVSSTTGDDGCSAGEGVMVPPLSIDADGASSKLNTQSPPRQITQDVFPSASASAKDAQVSHNA